MLFDLLNDVATLLESLKKRDYLRISNKKVYYLDKAPMVQSSPKMMSFNGIFLTCSCRFLHHDNLFQLAFKLFKCIRSKDDFSNKFKKYPVSQNVLTFCC